MRVVNELTEDPDSRRAAICILDNNHLNSYTKDYPCTGFLNFHIRDNKLHMTVHMRSQDAIYGMGNDAFTFGLVHELLWSRLKENIPGLDLGDYTHIVDSFHVYATHYGMVENILNDPTVEVDLNLECPLMTPGKVQYDELRIVVNHLSLYTPKKDDVYPLQLLPFTQWLITREDISTLRIAEYLRGVTL